MQVLTNQQRKFAEEHHQLIYGFLHAFRLPCEEWYGVAAIGYCKAVARYEPEQGWSFTTFAYRVMLNDVRMEMRKARAHKRRALILSLQSELCEGFTLEDTLGYEQQFIDDEPHTAAKDFINSMNPEQRFILSLLADGVAQGDIAKEMGVTRGCVTKQVKAIREKFDGEFPRRKEAAYV